MVCAVLHVICGNCGCKDEFDWEIEPKGTCNSDGTETSVVYIRCNNCATLHNLSEMMPERKDNGN